MWAHVDELEAETGLKLIERRKQNSSLTREGAAFVPYAASIIKAFEEGLDKARESDTGRIEGNIIIVTTLSVAHSWLMPSIKDFHLLYPDLSVNIIAEDQVSKKMELSADILLRPVGSSPDLIKKWYVSYRFGLFASQEYLDRMGTPQVPEDLATGHSVLSYGEHEFSHFSDINWHVKGGWGIPKLTPTLTVNSTTALYLATAEGIGIGSSAIESSTIYGRSLLRILPQIEGPEVKTYFCVKADASPSIERNVNVFRIFLEKYLKSLNININYEV